MADHTYTLSSRYNRMISPYAGFRKTIAGNDTLKIYSGVTRGIPDVWELVALYCVYTASADVANRFPVISNSLIGLPCSSLTIPSAIVANDVALVRIMRATAIIATVGIGAGEWILGVGAEAFGMAQDGDEFLWYVTDGHANDSIDFACIFKFMNRELGMVDPTGGGDLAEIRKELAKRI